MTEDAPVLTVRRDWLSADISGVVRVSVDRAGNPILRLTVRLMPPTHLGAFWGTPGGGSGPVEHILSEPTEVHLEITPDSVATLARLAAMNRTRKAKRGPIRAFAPKTIPFRREVR